MFAPVAQHAGYPDQLAHLLGESRVRGYSPALIEDSGSSRTSMSDVCTPNNTEPHKRLLGKLKQLAERLDDGMMHFIPHDVYLAQRLPSSSSVNPALTIMANALRVGDHLTERLGAAMPSAVQAPAQSMQAGLMSHAAAAR